MDRSHSALPDQSWPKGHDPHSLSRASSPHSLHRGGTLSIWTVWPPLSPLDLTTARARKIYITFDRPFTSAPFWLLLESMRDRLCRLTIVYTLTAPENRLFAFETKRLNCRGAEIAKDICVQIQTQTATWYSITFYLSLVAPT
jgi:hypothetical protein